MAEEKVVKINLRRQLLKVPKWRRKIDFIRLLKRSLGNVAVSQSLNERIWKTNKTAVRIKIIKDNEKTRIEPVE